MLNRHGLIAGATGTGKTKTLQLITEQLSAAGVPVFAADIKGDLSGLAPAGEGDEKLLARTGSLGQAWKATASPVEFLALGGRGPGVPMRATITSFGPTLLAKVLGLNETQESSLELIFHYADQAGLPLLDLKDLRAVVAFLVSDEGKPELKALGGLSQGDRRGDPAGAHRVRRPGRRPVLRRAGVRHRRPAAHRARRSRGDLAARAAQPARTGRRCSRRSSCGCWPTCSTTCPRSGDLDKPKLVFFFDEAHLLFDDASKAFLDAIEQTVRLIRSKGVGVFFVTQSPTDVPDVGARPARLAGAAPAARSHAERGEGAAGDRAARIPTRRTTSRRCSPSSASARRS